jgi:hypothetical protein
MSWTVLTIYRMARSVKARDREFVADVGDPGIMRIAPRIYPVTSRSIALPSKQRKRCASMRQRMRCGRG